MRSDKNKKRKERLSHIEDSMIGRWFSEHKVRLLRNVIHIQLHHEVNHFHLKTTFLHRTTIINRNYHHVTATTIVDYLINKQIKNVKTGVNCPRVDTQMYMNLIISYINLE